MKERLGRLFRRRLMLPIVVVSVLAGANGPPVWAFASEHYHEYAINRPEYKSQYGFWQVIELPKDMRVNAIHAALLETGKLLLIAGSGNDRTQFDAGTFKTLLFDPATGSTTLVPTPTDMFCAGHAFLPNGKLLVAGGTLRYEVLKPDVKRAGGTMTIKNESPDGAPRTFPKATEFVSPQGRRYWATVEFTVNPATKTETHKQGAPIITASRTTVWVDAEETGPDSISTTPTHYRISGLDGPDSHNIYGLADKLLMDKEDYQGRQEAYEFNPETERYERVSDMAAKRWYPTLTALADGTVLAVSGLDGSGQVLDGSQNEIFDPASGKWTVRRDLRRYFATYPAIFQTARPGVLFYSGSNSGYGLAAKGRDPGLWDLRDNSFHTVPGLRDANQTETSGSAWVGPVQDQTIMVVGGGGVGESARSTKRIDLIRLTDPAPHFAPGPDLPEGTRYPSLVQLPDDTTLITGGSRDYRGRGDSNNHNARIYHPDTKTLSYAADPHIGRDYHSAALLLPDGRVLTMGSDPLYSDKKNTITGTFEQRLELYTPAYLFRGARPRVTGWPAIVSYGEKTSFSTPDAVDIRTVRLIRPSAVTHMTNVEQRSIALDFTRRGNVIDVTMPDQGALAPPGYYMLFVTNSAGVPSVARWVQLLG